MSTHHRLRRVVSGLSTGGYAIDNSMVLNDNDAQYLQRSNPGTPTSADIGTISVWFKRGNFPSGNNLRIWNHGDGGAPNIELLIFGSSNKMLVNGDAAGGTSNTTTQVFRDPHAWTNAVVRINTRESVASDRVRLYINGTLVSDYDSTSYPNQNGDIFQSTPDWWVGRWSSATGSDWDGYISEVVYCDGQSLAPTAFGQFDDSGVWGPIDLTDTVSVSSTAEAIANVSSATTNSQLTTYTYSSVALGTASATRAIYVFVTAQEPGVTAPDIQTLTVGGVSASKVQDVSNSAEPQYYVSELWKADVPTGTTGDIVVTWNTAQSRCGVIAWAVTGDHFLYDIKTELANTSASLAFTDVPDGSVILAGRGGTGGKRITWGSDVTENIDQDIEPSGVCHSGASSAKSTGGDFTVTCARTDGTTDSRSRTFAIVLSPTQGVGNNGFYLPFTASGALGADYGTTRTAPSIAFVTSNSDTANTTSSYTFSSQSLGAAASDRKIFVCASMSAHTVATLTFGTVTIGGVTATQLVASETYPSPHNLHPMAIFVADVPSGTTGDIVLNVASGHSANCGIAIYRATACGEMFDSGSIKGNASGGGLSVTTQVPKGGFVLLHGNKNSEATRVTLTNVTEDYDFACEGDIGSGDPGGDLGIFGGLNTSAASSDAVGLTTTATSAAGSAFGQISISVAPIGDTSLKAVNSPTQTTDSPTTNAATFSSLITRHQTTFAAAVTSDWTFTNGNRTLTHTSGSSGDIMAAASQLLQPGQKYHFEVITESMHSSAYARFQLALVPESMWETDASPLTGTNNQFEISLIKSGGSGSNTATFDDSSLTAPTNKPTTNSRLTFEVDMSTIGSTTVRYYFNGSLDTTYSSLGFADEPYYVVSFTGVETDRNGVFNFNFGSSDFTDTPTAGHTGLTAKAAYAGSAPTVGDISDGYVAVTATEANIVSTLGAAHSYSSYMELYARRDSGEDKILKFSDDASNHLEFSSSNAKDTFPSLTGSAAWVGYAFNMSSTYGMFTDQVSHSTGSDTDTAHGLGANVGMVFVKREDATGQWFMLTSGNSSGYNQIWEYVGSPVAGNTGQQNSTVHAGYDGTNVKVLSAAPTGTYRVIAFANVPGFLDLRTYSGNGNADGSFVHTGHSCDWVCVFGVGASQSAYEKLTVDSTREPGNPKDLEIALANPGTGEDGDKGAILGDSISNGFKHRDGSAPNSTTNPYFMWSYGSPANGKSPGTAR